MPQNTQSLVTWIKDKYAPKWSRPNILDAVNVIQNKMFNHDCAQHVFTCDNSDFPVPFLKTTSGTIEYTITDANLTNAIAINGYATTCRRIKDVFIKIDSPYNVDYTRQYWRENFKYVYVNPWYTKSLSHVVFQRTPVLCLDSRCIQSCKVTFPEDPGTYTDRFYVEFWPHAVELTAETIPMCIDLETWFMEVVDGVVGLVEDMEYGDSKKWKEWKETTLPKYWDEMNKGDEYKPVQIDLHEC